MMKEVKSILISPEVHEKLKSFSLKSGKKIRSITEEAILIYLKEEEERNVRL